MAVGNGKSRRREVNVSNRRSDTPGHSSSLLLVVSLNAAFFCLVSCQLQIHTHERTEQFIVDAVSLNCYEIAVIEIKLEWGEGLL